MFCKENHYKLEKIYTDQQTGKNFSRPRYTVLRDDILRDGDILIITEVDRLGRNKKDTVEELRVLAERNIRVMILEIPTTLQDLSKLDNAMAKMILETVNHMLIELYAAMAQAEIEKKEKRQREGIEQMKERGEWDNYGRHRVMSLPDFEKEYQNVKDGKIKSLELMRKLNMKKSTYFKYVREIKLMNGNEQDV